jgi:RNA polymerase sigma-70 factor (ECF subfamily)
MVTSGATVEAKAWRDQRAVPASVVRDTLFGGVWGAGALAVPTGAHGERLEVTASVLRSAQRGDRDAFVRLMDHYDRRLRSLAYRLLDDRESTLDAMQDVYVKAFRALPAFEGRSSVGTWLYRITYTTCLEHLERRKARTMTYLDAEPPALDLVGDPADEATTRVDLDAALQALSAEARAAVLMVDRDGYDYRTTASALGVPVGTLASRLSAARTALRRALQGREVRP